MAIGSARAGRDEEGGYRALELVGVGDCFGEIAALIGGPRTANVIAAQTTTVLEVPAPLLRDLLREPQVHRFVLSRLTERMDMLDGSCFAMLNQGSPRELGTSESFLPVEPPIRVA